MPSVTTVPGRWPLIGHTATLLRNPVEFLSSLSARGDVVKVFLGPLPVHVVTIATRWDLVPVAGHRVHAQVKATMQPNRLPMTATTRRPPA